MCDYINIYIKKNIMFENSDIFSEESLVFKQNGKDDDICCDFL